MCTMTTIRGQRIDQMSKHALVERIRNVRACTLSCDHLVTLTRDQLVDMLVRIEATS